MALPNPLTDSDISYLEEQYWAGISNKNQASSGFELDDIIDAPIAIVTDIATSIANSVPFVDADFDTQEVLSSIGFDGAAEFYENHRTLVNVGSFIGGLVIPGMLVGKSLQLARAGKYSLLTGGKLVGSRINKLAKNKQLRSDQALSLVKQGDFYTKEYKRARRAWAGAALREGFMEGAAFEAAFIGLFNGHAFMDDYDTTDFVIGSAFGAAFVPLRFMWDRRVFRLQAAEVERQLAESAKVGAYKNHLGITGQKGDQLTARTHNATSMDEEIRGTDWTGNRGGFELAQRNQREELAAANDIAVGMLDEEAKLLAKKVSKPGVIAAEEADIYKQGPVGLILQTIKKNLASVNGVRGAKLFTSEAPLGRAAKSVSDIRYEAISDVRLRGSPDFTVEEFKGASVNSLNQILTGKRIDPNETFSAFSKLEVEDWRDLASGKTRMFQQDGVVFNLINKGNKKFELHLTNDAATLSDAALLKQGSAPNLVLRETLQKIHTDLGDVPMEIFIHHTAKRAGTQGALASRYNAQRGLSTEAGQFQTDSIPKSMTEDMLHGTRAPSPREIFLINPAADGRQVGAGIGHRDMLDLPDGHGSFVVAELPEGARIATHHDVRGLAEEATEQGLDLTQTGPAIEEFFRAKGFVGREVPNIAKRRSKAPSVQLFDRSGAKVKRRLPADAKAAAKEQRRANGIADDFDEFAVMEPYSQSIIPASVARSVQRAADIQDGYRVNKNFSMQGQTTREYDPFSMSSHEVDAMFMDALHAVRNQKPKSLIIDFDDLPRLQAAYLAQLNRAAIKVRLADGTIQPLRHNEEIANQVILAKSSWARRMNESGYGGQQISVYTNTPMRGVDMLIASGHRVDDIIRQSDIGKDFFTYDSVAKERLGEYLNAKQLVLEGDPLANQNGRLQQQWSKQDAELAQNIHNSIIGEVSAQQASKVPLVGQLYNLTDRSEFRAMIKHAATFFSREVLGKPTINSLDFALRKLDSVVDGEDLGQFVVQTGQDFLRHVNETIEPLRESMAGSFNAIAKDEAALMQFNDIYKALQKIPRDEMNRVVFSAEHGAFVTAVDNLGRPTNFLKYVRDGQFSKETISIKNADLEDFYVNRWPKVQDTLYELQNTNRKLAGMGDLQRLGVWFPYNNLSEQNVAYIFNRGDSFDKARLIVGKTVEELESQIKAISGELAPGQEIVRRADAEMWNRITGYSQLNELERADAGLQRSGILVEGTPNDTRIMNDILEAVSGDVWKHSRQYMRTAGSELFSQLDEYVKWHKVPQVSNAGTYSQKASEQISTPEVISKALLHQSLLADTTLLNSVNNVYSHMIEWSLDKLNRTWDDVLKKNGTNVGPEDWERISETLSEQNIPNPYKGWEDMVRQNPEYQGANAKQFIARANSVLVTLNLRLMELSHAAITSFTIPVVIAAELAARDMPLRYMMAAAKKMLTTKRSDDQIRRVAREKGYSTGRIAEEVSKLMRTAIEKPSLLTKVKESRLVDLLSKPSDLAEDMAREMAYLTGYEVGMQKYGRDAATSLLETFANQFTNRTMGNYTSRQRPTAFQGSFGATIGLYQTFMLSMGQQMFRFLEAGQKRGFMTLIGAQSGMFGMSTLPFYDPINRAIGAYVSDDNNDITSTAYEMFGDSSDNSRSMAEFILYGLPSTLTQGAFYTRGELQPRPPISLSAPFEEGAISVSPPLINTIKQLWDFSWDTGNQMALAIQDGAPIDAARAIAEGLSVQSIWRPAARISEIITGSSFDRSGKIIDANTEAAMNWATFARVMGSRPLKEQVLRNLNFTGRYYDSIDQGNRREAIQAFRSAVAQNDFTRYGSIMQEYMDNGGTMEGWTANENEAYLQAGTPYGNRLLDDLSKRDEITGILSGYLW